MRTCQRGYKRSWLSTPEINLGARSHFFSIRRKHTGASFSMKHGTAVFLFFFLVRKAAIKIALLFSTNCSEIRKRYKLFTFFSPLVSQPSPGNPHIQSTFLISPSSFYSNTQPCCLQNRRLAWKTLQKKIVGDIYTFIPMDFFLLFFFNHKISQDFFHHDPVNEFKKKLKGSSQWFATFLLHTTICYISVGSRK